MVGSPWLEEWGSAIGVATGAATAFVSAGKEDREDAPVTARATWCESLRLNGHDGEAQKAWVAP